MYVYFMRQVSGGPIKIGHAVDPANRLRTAQPGNPDTLEILAVCRGTVKSERFLHKYFAKHREQGEWFSPAPELMELISTLPTWEAVKAGADCPQITNMQDWVWALRKVGYSFQQIGDFYGISRQRAHQLCPAGWRMKDPDLSKLKALEDKDRPPIEEFVSNNPEIFASALILGE